METATAPTAPSAAEASTQSKTIADLLPLAAERHADPRAVIYKDQSGQWVSKTYREVGEIVRKLSLGLIDLGVEKGDKVSILANTRPEWTYFDFAALSAGATVVPIYQTNSPEECQYVLENSDAKVVIVEDDEQLEKVHEVRDRCPKLEHVIRMEGSGGRRDLDGRAGRERRRALGLRVGGALALGHPRRHLHLHLHLGHHRAAEGLRDLPRQLPLDADDGARRERARSETSSTYLFLPLAHSFALLIQFLSFDLGGNIAYWERDPLKIVPNLSEVKPDYFPSVPRIFEKIYTAATSDVEKAGGLKKIVFNWAVGVGEKVRERERAGKRVGWLLRKQYEIADKQVLSKIRALFGGRIKNCVTGAAPINPDILRFFDAAGVLVLEGWGMTETSTAATIARPDAFKFGTVGRAFQGCEIRIADDGEILVKGPNVFQGYYKNDEATRETIVDGWLHTGDIGEIDEDGYLKITGRKKDIIITAGGKNITPANLEAEIKQSPYVSQCVVIGDRRPYLVALVTLDPEEGEKLAKENDWPADPAALGTHEGMRALIQAHLDQINEKFARVEQVKKFEILPHDLSQEGGELTPTLKVKRAVVAEKYEGEIDSLYAK